MTTFFEEDQKGEGKGSLSCEERLYIALTMAMADDAPKSTSDQNNVVNSSGIDVDLPTELVPEPAPEPVPEPEPYHDHGNYDCSSSWASIASHGYASSEASLVAQASSSLPTSPSQLSQAVPASGNGHHHADSSGGSPAETCEIQPPHIDMMGGVDSPAEESTYVTSMDALRLENASPWETVDAAIHRGPPNSPSKGDTQTLDSNPSEAQSQAQPQSQSQSQPQTQPEPQPQDHTHLTHHPSPAMECGLRDPSEWQWLQDEEYINNEPTNGEPSISGPSNNGSNASSGISPTASASPAPAPPTPALPSAPSVLAGPYVVGDCSELHPLQDMFNPSTAMWSPLFDEDDMYNMARNWVATHADGQLFPGGVRSRYFHLWVRPDLPIISITPFAFQVDPEWWELYNDYKEKMMAQRAHGLPQ